MSESEDDFKIARNSPRHGERQAALARIQAHVEALEGALRTIAANEYGPDGDGPDFQTIARDALAGETESV